MHANKSAYFVTQDQIGSSTLLTNVSGGVADCNAFYPFGEQDSSICATTNTTTHKFTGKERDSESNLDNFGARYYGSSLGRFMSPDPGPMILLNPQSYNAYTYALNNPLRYTDTTGLTPKDRIKAAKSFVGIAYLSGGKNPLCGLDCSGLVQNVFKADTDNTIPALRTRLTAAHQAQQLQFYGWWSTEITKAKPGDAIFFANPRTGAIVHTGIVVDVRNGMIYFVDAPNPSRPVSKDRMLMKHAYWGGEKFAGVGRPLESPRQSRVSTLPATSPSSLSEWLEEWFFHDVTEPSIQVVSHRFVECGEVGVDCPQ